MGKRLTSTDSVTCSLNGVLSSPQDIIISMSSYDHVASKLIIDNERIAVGGVRIILKPWRSERAVTEGVFQSVCAFPCYTNSCR
jgi:hypothetical protein